MPRTAGIGHQNFEKIRISDNFYVDKTKLIKEWWEANDEVTLITRPRRFGKTLNMSMIEQFFSVKYAGKGELFEGLFIWEHKNYRKLQGTYPVISLSFANIKERDYNTTRRKICQLLSNLYSQNAFLLDAGILDEREKDFFQAVSINMGDAEATLAIHQLSCYLSRYYGKKVIILLDEYDTPMQDAYVEGYWEDLATFTRGLFNAAFKTNPYLERAIMTGITRVSRESMFSDLNNLKVVTTTSEEYADCFGFTEGEVFAALEEFGLSERRDEVKRWYDGFIFGNCSDIYNPWSIINYLNTGKVGAYWANTSSNSLAGKLIREGTPKVKQEFESLMRGEALRLELDEQIVYSRLPKNNAIWSLLLAGGYLKVEAMEFAEHTGRWYYSLVLTNLEVRLMFEGMVREWFSENDDSYHDFIRALLDNDLEAMNESMNDLTCELFSSFDTGRKPSGKTQPERFYHGFVLGLMVELQDRYVILSNRESGYGRYDIMLEPKEKGDDAYIIEFKVVRSKKSEALEDAVNSALEQIEKKQYEAELQRRSILPKRIRKYGFAFEGKNVLIGGTGCNCP